MKKKVNVNLGCGSNIVEGFINIDCVRPSNADKNFVLGDVLNIPLKDNSVDYIIMDQVLEHIAMADIVPALHQIRRVLKVGGRCVIIVPDFEDAVRSWLKYNVGGSFNPLTYQFFSEVVYGNQMHEGEFHKTPMSPLYLNYALNTAGLVQKEILMYPTDSDVPVYPGIRPAPPQARCRNAQLVADIIKTS